MTLPPPDTPAANAAAEVVTRLHDAEHTALWAGGCVRDILLGRTPKDYDVATSAPANESLALFPGAIAVGRAFGVVRVPRDDQWIEVATFREDADYSDGRHPDAVRFSDAEHDAQRRDFTINALFYDPLTHHVIDYVDGLRDLDAGVLRCVGDPNKRFAEDHLRLLRAVRFAATLGFAIDGATRAAARANAAWITRTSPERIRVELERTLCEAPRAGDAIRMLDELGLLDMLLPEVAAMKGQDQPPEFHPEGDVFAHTVLMLNQMQASPPTLAWSVLLHDVGKPVTAAFDGNRWRFNNHAKEGAHLATAILRRLHASTRLIEDVSACVAGHMRFADVPRMKRSTLRRMVGRPTFATELELHRLDCLGSHGDVEHHAFLEDVKRAFDSEPVLPDPLVTGRDVLALGVPEGPDIGRLKQQVYDAQLDGHVATREDALAYLREAALKQS